MILINGYNYVECQICKKKMITVVNHIQKVHNISLKKYKRRFPNEPYNCDLFNHTCGRYKTITILTKYKNPDWRHHIFMCDLTDYVKGNHEFGVNVYPVPGFVILIEEIVPAIDTVAVAEAPINDGELNETEGI